jgi:hypothetical protein
MRRAWFGGLAEVAEYVARTKADLQRYVDATVGSAAPWIEEMRRTGVTDESVHQRALTGDPEEAADVLARWAAEVGIDQIQLKLQWGNRDFAALRRQLTLSEGFVRRLTSPDTAVPTRSTS